jgi:hypothetical protein
MNCARVLQSQSTDHDVRAVLRACTYDRWMRGIVQADFEMTFTAHGNCVADVVAAAFRFGIDMVGLHFEAAEPVADAAAPVIDDQQRGDLVAAKRHEPPTCPSPKLRPSPSD